jgi:hypothetical protein
MFRTIAIIGVLIFLAASSLPTGLATAADQECNTTDKPCPAGEYCAGINPNAPGMCVANWPHGGLCKDSQDCPKGFYCAGINPNAPGMCVAVPASCK